MPFKEASMQHPTSCGQNILDTQVNGPYTASNEKQVLINHFAPETLTFLFPKKIEHSHLLYFPGHLI